MPISSIWAWNATGHRLIAEIAYEHLTIHAKQTFDHYNNAVSSVYKPETFVESSVWLDNLSYKDIHWFAPMHYIDIPYSTDGSALPTVQKVNALWAIDNATKLLLNKYPSDFDKGIAFRILLHIIGDIHQPLHAITKVSTEFPEGDKGGNLVLLHNNPVAKNLHAYWDRGAGLFMSNRLKPNQIEEEAARIEAKWPCSVFPLISDATEWVHESHAIAVNDAYHFPINHAYQIKAQQITEKRIAAAGCRLAEVLNEIDAQIPANSIRARTIKTRRARKISNNQRIAFSLK